MPELPEVEATRRLLAAHLLNKKIIDATVLDDTSTGDASMRPAMTNTPAYTIPPHTSEVVQGIAPADLQSQLIGCTVVDTGRKGKHMWLVMADNKPHLLIHLGTTHCSTLTSTVHHGHAHATVHHMVMHHLIMHTPPQPHVLPYHTPSPWATGMNGTMIIRGIGASKYKRMDVDTEAWPPRFWKLTLEFHGGLQVAFTDARRFGKIQFVKDPLTTSPLSNMGPEYVGLGGNV